jgi:acetyl-CoA carboxylase carboxyl transferase subunit beta
MSWLEKLLPPKIQQTDPTERRTVPEGLWIKCPSCETVLYKTDLEQNLNVCPKCDHHHRIGARARLDAFLDPEGRWEIGQEVLPVDPLKFKDSKKYPERLKAALEATGETDALVVVGGAVMSVPVVAACFEFDFMGGSMGSGGGRALRAGRGSRHRAEGALHQLCGHRRRAHAGRPAEPAADGQDQCRADAPGQGQAALHQRADRPHHGRRVGQLCLRGRRGDRRAQGADRLCRPARDREHRAREAARRLPAQRIPARQGRAGHDRDRRQTAPAIASLLAMLQRQSADAVA